MKTIKNTIFPGGRQRGVAILAITVILLLVATIGTLVIGRIGLNEQKVVGSDVRSKEVYSAAVGGLEYGVDWFAQNFETVSWSGSGPGSTATATGVDTVALQSNTYNRTVTYTTLTPVNPANDAPLIVRVSSMAAAVGDSHITKTVQKDVMLGKVSVFSSDSGGSDLTDFSAPPIVVEACVNDFTGTPDVYLHQSTPPGIGIGSTMGTGDPATCLPPGHLDQSSCTNTSTNPYSGCTLVNPTQTRILGSRTLWSSVFGDATMEDLLELEEREPNRIVIVDENYSTKRAEFPASPYRPNYNGNNWPGGTYGTAADPVILFFAESAPNAPDYNSICPGFQGGVTIYGIVYFEYAGDKDSTPACLLNGLGNVEIYGSLAKEGNMSRLNANIEIYGQSLDFGGGGGTGTGTSTKIEIGFKIPKFAEIPGSWADY